MKADRHSCRLTEPDLAAAEGMGTERSRKDSKQWLSFLQACGGEEGSGLLGGHTSCKVAMVPNRAQDPGGCREVETSH